jgi:hypothetical protein
MVVQTFVTHLRSELALHRWDLVGDDETSTALLGQFELTQHAVAVLGRALLVRGANTVHPGALSAVISSPGALDVEVLVDAEDSRLTFSDAHVDPVVVADPAARFLLLWGRRPSPPWRLSVPGGAARFGQLQAMLSGY